MTVTVTLTEEQRQQLISTAQQQAAAIVSAAESGAVRSDAFVYFAAFDGTNNDLEPPAGELSTNVAQLWFEYVNNPGFGTNFDGRYVQGPGTKGTLTASSWLASQVTRQAILAAEQTYADFAAKASAWIQTHPGKSVEVALAAFSRGDASAAIFSQLIFEKGLKASGSDTFLIPPGQIRIDAGVLFDPVTTQVSGNLAFAPTTRNVVDIFAANEYRYLFKAGDYSN